MSVPANTYQTYQEVGIKEDVSDVITNISPRKTPFLSSIGDDKVHQPLFQWQEDSLRTVRGQTSAGVQGGDASLSAAVPTVMRNNYTQIFIDAVGVAGTTQATAAYGRSRELAYQMAKTAAQLKRDLETAFVGTAQSSGAGSATTAATMASFQEQIATANVFYAGASTNLTEALLVQALEEVYNQGADPTRIMVTPANSIIVAAFAAAAGRYRTIPTEIKGANGTIVNAVNLYVSPFGEQKVELNRFLKAVGTVITGNSTSTAGNTLIFDPDMWTKATLRPWTRENLAKTGDSEKQMLVGEFSLKHKNYQASAVIVDNAASGF